LGGSILSARRIDWRDLLPFGVIGSILTAVYSVGATVYVPHLFSSYATRYGVIGAVFAMISTLFCVFLVVVGSAALGREVGDELGRIRRGERPPDNELRSEWARWSARCDRGGVPLVGGSTAAPDARSRNDPEPPPARACSGRASRSGAWRWSDARAGSGSGGHAHWA
jgi:hypothetical protein